MEYLIRNLTYEETAEVYGQWIGRHFPKEEIKPLASIERMWNQDAYRALGFYVSQESGERKELAAYAFLLSLKQSKLALLDYLAVLEPWRSRGVGGLFLKEMPERLQGFDGFLIETEDIDFAQNDKERKIRQKRDAFYGANNAVKTGIRTCVRGVHYTIWYCGAEGALSEKICRENLESIYRIMFPGEKYDQYVEIQ